MVLIEGNGRFVFGVDDQREDRRLGECCSCSGIHNKCTAKPLAAKLAVDGEPADQPGGQERNAASVS